MFDMYIVQGEEIKWNLKKTASMKVNAGVRLLIAESRVGEL